MNLEVFAVNAMIIGIGMMDVISSVSYYCSDESLRYFHSSSGTRENNFLIQVEIAQKLSGLIGARFGIRNSEFISFKDDEKYVVDVNAIRKKQQLPDDGNLRLLAITPESMSPLLGLRFIMSPGMAKSRWRCFKNLYWKKSIPLKVHSLIPARRGTFIEVTNILGKNFQRRIFDLSSRFASSGYSNDFTEIWNYLESNPDSFLVVVLPTPYHYGGTESEDLQITLNLQSNFNPESTLVLIKNHPSDLVRHSIFDTGLKNFSMIYWHTERTRNLPIELLTIPFQERLCLLSSGSSAQYSINPKSSKLVKSPTKYSRKLYKNIYGSLNLLFGISKF